MTLEDLQRHTTLDTHLITGARKLPQELCDIIIRHAPQETLSQCSLVCRGWVCSSSRCLFDTFLWPPKPVRLQARDISDPNEHFTGLLDALVASPRLRDAIHCLQLGTSPKDYLIMLSTPAYDIRVSTLVSILGLCARLDDILLRHCRILASDTAVVEPGQFDGLYAVALIYCPTLDPSNMQGIVEFLSLFKRISHLVVSFREPVAAPIEQSPSLCFPKTLELRSISWHGLTYFSSPESGNTSLYFLKHLRQISNIHESLHSVSAGSGPTSALEYLQNMNHLEDLEIYIPSPYTRNISAIRNIRSLRRLVLHSQAQVSHAYGQNYWPLVMEHLDNVPPRLPCLVISFLYIDTPREDTDETLGLFEKSLLGEDWQPLERFTERCPSVSVELRVKCVFVVAGYLNNLPEVDPDRVVEVARNVASKYLSERASKSFSVQFLHKIY